VLPIASQLMRPAVEAGRMAHRRDFLRPIISHHDRDTAGRTRAAARNVDRCSLVRLDVRTHCVIVVAGLARVSACRSLLYPGG